MPTEVVILFAALAASFGTLAVIAVGARCTRNLQALGWGGACSGAALGALAYICLGWFAHGFEPLHVWVLPLAGLVLLLVMVAQNWFVFYEDREDRLQSARPTLVMLAAAAALALAAHLGPWRAATQSMIWAGAISAVLVLSIHPLNRSIAANGSAPIGILVGTAKLLVPSTGIIALMLIDWLADRHRVESRPQGREDRSGAEPVRGLVAGLLLLIWDLGQLLLIMLTNGPRFVPHPGLSAADFGAAHRRGQLGVADISLSKRNTAILMLVVALHLLGGLILVRG